MVTILAGCLKALVHYSAGVFLSAAGQLVKLVETADHGDLIPDAGLGFSQDNITAHFWGICAEVPPGRGP